MAVDYSFPNKFNILNIIDSDLTEMPLKDFERLIRLMKYHVQEEIILESIWLTDRQLEIMLEQ